MPDGETQWHCPICDLWGDRVEGLSVNASFDLHLNSHGIPTRHEIASSEEVRKMDRRLHGEK